LSAGATVSHAAQDISLTGEQFEIALCADNGSIVKVAKKGQGGTVFASGENGLWQARLADGRSVDAASFSATSGERRFHCARGGQPGVLRFEYRSTELDVTVNITSGPAGIDFSADVSPHGQTVLEFALPARLQFDPAGLDRLICPAGRGNGVGWALRESFFRAQPQPTGWRSHSTGPKGYQRLYGGSLVSRDIKDPPIEIRVTEEGRKWLGRAVPTPSSAIVNRAPKPDQADLVLVDSAHGPYFSASHLRGKGYLWRIGGAVREPQEKVTKAMVGAVVERLAKERPAARNQIGLLALRCGPLNGTFTTVAVYDWRRLLRGLPAVVAGKVQVTELVTLDQLNSAQTGGQYLAIVNPYGEGLPVAKAEGMDAAVAAVSEYIRQGGNWFEVGGYSFHSEMRPSFYHEISEPYPSAFADYFHFQSTAGAVSLYRVRPRDWAPWSGVKDQRAIFVPGRLECGGNEQGGWCDRPFGVYVVAGTTWRSPRVRLVFGQSAAQSIRQYAEANGITRRLEEKMRPEVLEKFKRSVLVNYRGTCAEKEQFLGLLPAPTLIHFADYLHGGFDKQYPDHLPPLPKFGTPNQFRQFIDAAHKLGHLVMPYTNPTWWCDNPKGPTFEQYGDAPLLRHLNGKVAAERYRENTGFTICFWHPAVQEANRRTVRQFTEEYPMDILFQDQCGARGWHHYLSSAGPTPAAYTEGLLSMVDEDSRRVPLSTENGWDGVVNGESQLCGMTWSIVPTEGRPGRQQYMKDLYDPATWEVFPLAQYLAHDKTAMIHHDLGQFVTHGPSLAWTLALGYGMSYRVHAASLSEDRPRHWLLWLDRLQKSVCSRYVGEALDDFQHQRDSQSAIEDDGVIRARYGRLNVVANLGPRPRIEAGKELASYGFLITAPDLVAANLAQAAGKAFGEEGVSFVAEARSDQLDVWFYAAPGTLAAFLPPSTIRLPIKLTFDDGAEAPTTAADNGLLVQLPSKPNSSGQASKDGGQVKYLWHATARLPSGTPPAK
jgi:hypothetical protein